MMETYRVTAAELATEIYIAVGTQIYIKSNHDIWTRKKLSLTVGRSEGQDRARRLRKDSVYLVS